MALPSRIHVPSTEKQPLTILDKLTDAQFENYITALDLAVPRLHIEDFDNQVRLLWMAKEKAASVKGITTMAIRAARTAVQAGMSVSDVADALLSVDGDDDNQESNVLFSEHLKNRLQQVLSAKNVQITAQAILVMTAQQNPVLGTRIFSDIRPVFVPDASEARAAASVIIHQLQIRVSTATGTRAAYYALDDNDLLALRSVVEAAIKRAEVLREAEFESGRLLIKA